MRDTVRPLLAATATICLLLAGSVRAQDEGKSIEPSPGPERISAQAVGGPDGFGYTFIDSAETGGPAFAWIDISTTGTPLGLFDDSEANVTLPFEFPYYGVPHTLIRIGNNGGLLLSPPFGLGDVAPVSGDACPLPSIVGSLAPRISVFWDDIDADTGNVYHQAFASCPATQGGTGPCWVVEWFNRPHFNNTGSATFEAVLWQNGQMLFQYLDTDFGVPAWDAGAAAAIGIEDEAQDPGFFLSYSCNGAAVPNSHAVLWRPPSAACVQGFDTVTAPALPAGWSAATIAGDATGWVNVGTLADSPVNRVTVGATGAGTDDHVLQSEVYPISSATAQLQFRHSYRHPSAAFGTVLETRVNAGAWTDIVTAGGTFALNGYNGLVTAGPLNTRSAWTNSTQVAYQTVLVNLPASMNGQDVEFRWRRGKTGTAPLAFSTVDTVSILGCSRCALTCPADINAFTEEPLCSATVNFAPATGVGACAPIQCTPGSPSVFPLGVSPVDCGEIGGTSCSFNVTVADDDDPILTVPPPIVVGTDPGVCTAVVGFNVTAVDNCDLAPVVACVPPSGSTFPFGLSPVACTATDDGGNVGNGGFNVTVFDDENPTIQPLPDLALDNDPGLCSAVATYTPIFADNCPGAAAACVPVSGSTFPVGTSPVVCTVTDGGGLQASDSFNVAVTDVEAPVVTAPDSTVNNDPGLCSAVVTFTPSAVDNCAVVGAITCVPPSGSVFPVGVTPGSCTADDAAGNQGSDPFNVTVLDVEAPVLTCPADIELDLPPQSQGQNVDFDDPLVADNCPGSGAPLCDPASGDLFPAGTTTVDCSASDASGNEGTCSFSVTLNSVSVLEVPTMSPAGLGALGLALAALALLALRRRSARE